MLVTGFHNHRYENISKLIDYKEKMVVYPLTALTEQIGPLWQSADQ